MAYEKKEGDISIFKNETANDKAPAYKGTAFINGMDFNVSLWVKEGNKGKFFSGRIEPKLDKLPPKDMRKEFHETDGLPF